MVSSTFHQIQNNFSNWNVLYAVLFEKQIYNSKTFNDKNRWIIRKVMVLQKLLPHLATRGTYSPGDWRYDEALREQTLVYPPVMCQQRFVYCTWELNSHVSVNNDRKFKCHDDVIHFPRYWPFVRGIHRLPLPSPHKGQWHGALLFYLICAWTNYWINNRGAGDLKRHHAHNDVTVMYLICFLTVCPLMK